MIDCVRAILQLGWVSALAVLSAKTALAGQPRLDADTCKQLHSEQSTFVQSGILSDLQKGAAWARTNLSADRLREIEHYIVLDEQIKFGCREATLTPEMEKAGEIAKRLELDPNSDPFAPLAEPGAAGSEDGDDAAAAPDPKAEKKKPAAKAKPGNRESARPKAEQGTAKANAASSADAAAPGPAAASGPKEKPVKKPKPQDAYQPEATGARSVPLTAEPIQPPPGAAH